MAFEGGSLTTNPNSNYFSFLARKTNEGKIPNPSEIITGSEHVYVVDSRERDLKLFPNPARFSIKFNEKYKNVTSIELKGSVIPKSEYNVNTQNMFIPFNVEDFITDIEIKDPGYGYIDGTYGFGAVPPNNLMATVSRPAITGGVNAQITVVVSGSSIVSVVLQNPGSGYLRGFYGGIENPSAGFYLNAQASFVNGIPVDNSLRNRFKQAEINIIVGHELVARLTPGQYDFAHPNDSELGLCREVTRSLQAAIDKNIANGTITPVVGGPQSGAQYFPYSVLDSNDGSCYLVTVNPNASANTNVVIQRGNDNGLYLQNLFLELLWSSDDFNDSSAINLLGYGTSTMTNKFMVLPPSPPVDQTSGVLGGLADPWVATPVTGRNNYDLTDTPKYVILTIGDYGNEADRLESTNDTLNTGFATLVFDANTSDVVFRSPSADPAGTGASNWASLLNKPGITKAIKGADFETKVISFGPAPLAELNGFTLTFKKYNGDLYDFHGKEWMLIFQFGANDINTGNRF
jgi:hypothetical protein